MFRWISIALIAVPFFVPVLAEAQSLTDPVTITDDDIVGNVTFTSDRTYVLSGLVFVEDGETLTIQPGTVIKGKPTSAEGEDTALIVARGGKIFANGTAENPIIFTAEADDVDDPNDILLSSPTASRGLWGGVIILGKASINTATGLNNIEGIDATTEPRGIYGGGSNPDDDDNSGVFRYVSIRHGGAVIGADNEINGLTMGGVGRGTTIEHVEVFYNQDDGFEWFGGTVNTRYLVSAFAGDDAYDYDEGFRGKHQFWFSIQDPAIGDHAGEHDGGTDPEDGTPYARPVIVNATYIGRGANAMGGKDNNGIIFRDNAGGMYYNSIFTEFKGRMLSIEDLDPTRSAQDSRARLDAGDLAFQYNILGAFGAGSTAADLGGDPHTTELLADASNVIRIADPMLQGISWNRDEGLDPRPTSTSPALDGSKIWQIPSSISPNTDDSLIQTSYTGAFSRQDLWLSGWTALSQMGYVGETELVDDGRRLITDADIDGNVTFTSDTEYVLSGLVFVEDGETLTIEAGTVIKGKPTSAEGEDTALIVARGGKIFANGTAENPIIFTAEADDVDDPNDILLSSPTASRGLWGGVIILGKASINTATGENNIEGIDATTEPRGIYGGGSNPDDDDNSGVFRYVSIRHGGAVIGADNEINGLTMGGVGRGTTIEHVEVFYNQDDGFEWFGGTVNTRYLVSAFAGDDAYDYDEGFRGEHQFWFSIQDPAIGDHAGEHDGGTDPEDGTPYASPVIVNATYIGRGAGAMGGKDNNGIIFRDNAGGMYYNSIFTEFKGRMLSIEDLDPSRSAQDSKARLDTGDLAFQYNILGAFGSGSTPADLGGDAHTDALLADASNVIRIADPRLQGISWSRNEGLDPRPTSTSPALDGSKVWQIPATFNPNADGRLTQTSYTGAFSRQDLWLSGWTALSQMGYVGETELVDDGRRLITDADIDGNVTFTSDTEYVLSGLVFVEDGETLTIEAGTVIKGKPTSAEGEDTALIVARGGKIFANGTAENPIIFTAEADDVDDPNDILLSSPTASRGLWGGVIILGKASINTATGLNNIEGIDATTEPRGIYGGGANPNDDDNSGVFRYVSIRHGGAVIGADNEINGLTMGGVGRGTTIEHVEVFFNQDDGFEWFGGTVNTRYLVSAFAGDDAFDYDEGFRGEHQYWFSIQDPAIGDHAGEHDGGTDPEDGTPYARPVIVNATYIGRGANAMGGKDNNGIIFRDNAGGMYYSSIFTEFKGRMLSIEDLDPTRSAQDSKARLDAGDLAFQYNILGAFGAGSTAADLGGDAHTDALLADASNVIRITDPRLQGISWSQDEGLDPRPRSTSPALDGSKVWQIPSTLSPNAHGRLAQNTYSGAFSRQDLWIEGWTALSEMGYVGRKEDVDEGIQLITDADIVGNVTFTSDTEYVLSGLVFVEDGETLTIEAGTVIKGKPTSAEGEDTALIVARGGKIFANGTAENPIIFTAEADDVDDPNDILLSSPTASRGLWGGVIILGKASINTATGLNNIEGIDATTEPRGIYGGGANPNDDDNSGVFRYVSIRHGGAVIGADNEINGLTMGGVGRGTTIEHVEVFYNQDDGFEWFGGTVNTRYLVSAFAGDDAFDYDEGFRGEHQYWFSIQDPAIGDHAGEHDGGTDPEDGTPYARPVIVNATYIGRGANAMGGKDNNGIIFRDNAGGMYYSSIFTEFKGHMLSIEDLDPSRSAQDSRARLDAGDLAFQYNILGAFGAGSTAADLGGDAHTDALLADASNVIRITDPMLQGISWSRNEGLDPRPTSTSPALDGSKVWQIPSTFSPNAHGRLAQNTYAGAFSRQDLWIEGWTALSEMGYVGRKEDVDEGIQLITDSDIVGNVTFTSNNTYVLSGLVFVEDGETLTIEAGTVIKGKPTSAEGEDTALIVARGGKIFANGTAENPIIFTAEADDVDDPNDILLSSPTASRGLWGGVIILGKASINTATGENNIEGIDATTEPRGIYGGGANPNDDDNSGVFRYVSIRHGGAVIGADNEINGLTMGGVGRGTTIEHVEVFFNQDDGFEWFGGTVNTRYLVSAFAGDDAYDYDEGFRGEHQYWFSIQDPAIGDHAGEHDGGTDPEDGTPYARPVIVNATYIGRGANAEGGKDNNGIIFRDNAGGMYYSSIFTEFKGHMLSIEDLDPSRSAQDSKARLDAGDLAFQHNILGSFGAGSTPADLGGDEHTAELLADASNVIRIADPMLQGISWSRDEGLDPRPTSTSPALDGSKVWQIPAAFSPNTTGRLRQNTYAGAFSRNDLWLEGWTALSELGYIGKKEDVVVEGNMRVVTDADIVGNVTFSADSVYILSGLVFVEEGETLTIEPGTVIKGRATGTSGDDSALIVARGGKIFADGTARNPIIFTAEADDVNDPNDILLSSPTASRGLWGGVIILGNASINTATGEGNIEGIDASTEPRGIYGGGRNPNDDDNSGVFRYVSIRHGGTDIGANNEINGLTMGGVGRGTTIEHVEVFYNQDDGFEWFGGTVNTRFLISAFAGDDSFDYDEGFRGEHQFWFSIQDPAIGDHAGEHDGGTDPEDGRPYASPTIMNATYIGRGAASTGGKDNNGIIFRDNAGGMYFNSIFTEFQGHMLSIEDLDPSRSAQDSKARLDAGDLAFQYNILGAFGAGNTPADLGGDIHSRELLANEGNANRITDPMLQGISWNRNRGLDPRPGNTSPAWDASKLMEEPRSSGFFMDVDYAGAFGTENWAANWSALADLGYFSTAPPPVPTPPEEPGIVAPDAFSLAQNSPNPFDVTTNIDYAVSSASHVKIEVYNLLGQRVATVVNDIRLPGYYTEHWDAQHLSSGVYFYRFEATADGRTAQVFNRKMTLLK